MASQEQWIKLITPADTPYEIGLLSSGDDLKIEKAITILPDVGHRQARDFRQGKRVGTGGVTLTELRPEDGLGELLYGIFGAVSSTPLGAVAYRHTFTPVAQGTALPEYTIVKNLGSVQEEYTGCKINSLSITTHANEKADVSFDIVSKGGNTTTGEAVGTYDEGTPFHADEGTLTIDDTPHNIANIDLKFSNNIADGADTFAIDGSLTRAITPEGDFKLELSLDVIADDSTMIDSLLGGTPVDIDLTLTSSTNIEGGTPYQLVFTIPRAQVKDRGKVTKVEGGVIVEDVSLEALYDVTGSANLCTATLDNSIDSYPRGG